MLAACRTGDEDIIDLLLDAGYEMFEFALPAEAPSPSFCKRFAGDK